MVSTLFRDPQARSSALAALGTLQPQAFGSLNCIETLDSTSNYYLIYRFTRSPSKSISSSIIHLHWGTSGFRGTDIDRRSDCCCATDSQYCHEEEHVRLYMHWCIHAYDICCTLSLWIHNSHMHNTKSYNICSILWCCVCRFMQCQSSRSCAFQQVDPAWLHWHL